MKRKIYYWVLASMLVLGISFGCAESAKCQTKPVQEKSFVGGGINLTYSSELFHKNPSPGIFIVGQKDFGRLKLKGIFDYKSRPDFPTIFHSDKIEEPTSYLDGYEIKFNPEVQYNFATLKGFKVFAGTGVTYYRHTFNKQQEKEQGKKINDSNFYNQGLNPEVSLGFHKGNHSFQVTRVLQEFKVKRFKYFTFNVVEHEYNCKNCVEINDEYYEYIPQFNLGNKGTFNPAYLQGTKINYSWIKPINNKYSLYFNPEFGLYDFRKAIGKNYVSYYKDHSTVATLRLGIVF